MGRKGGHGRLSDCPIANALDLIGDKWTLLVLRDLLTLGKSSFSEFAASEERIATNILAERLKKLERAGLITVRPSARDARRNQYSATRKGRDLLPVLLAIIRWSNAHIPGTNVPPPSFFRKFES